MAKIVTGADRDRVTVNTNNVWERIVGIENSLDNVETNYTPRLTNVESQLAEKATKAEVDTKVAQIVSGSPKGTYATLSALQTAFPTGTTGVYIVSADGKWYYWNGSAWTVGGIYQSTGFSKNGVSGVNIKPRAISINHVNNPTVGILYKQLNSSMNIQPIFKFLNVTIAPTDVIKIEYKTKYPNAANVTALKSFFKVSTSGTFSTAKNNQLPNDFENHTESSFSYEGVIGIALTNENLDVACTTSLSVSGLNFEMFIYDVKVSINGVYLTAQAYDGAAVSNVANEYSSKAYPYKIMTDDMMVDYALKTDVSNTSDNKLFGKTIFCLGDSLTEGDYGSNPPGTKNIQADNYPYFLKNFLSCTTVNHGKSGYTTTSYWDLKLKTIDFSTAEIIVIMLGTNGGLTDTLVADTTITEVQTYENYATTYTGSYAKIIEYCLQQTGGLVPIFLVHPPITSNRTDSSLATIYSVINQLGQKYACPTINFMYESGVSRYTQSIYQPLDGIHLNRDGYETLATYIGSQLKAKYRSNQLA